MINVPNQHIHQCILNTSPINSQLFAECILMSKRQFAACTPYQPPTPPFNISLYPIALQTYSDIFIHNIYVKVIEFMFICLKVHCTKYKLHEIRTVLSSYTIRLSRGYWLDGSPAVPLSLSIKTLHIYRATKFPSTSLTSIPADLRHSKLSST